MLGPLRSLMFLLAALSSNAAAASVLTRLVGSAVAAAADRRSRRSRRSRLQKSMNQDVAGNVAKLALVNWRELQLKTTRTAGRRTFIRPGGGENGKNQAALEHSEEEEKP